MSSTAREASADAQPKVDNGDGLFEVVHIPVGEIDTWDERNEIERNSSGEFLVPAIETYNVLQHKYSGPELLELKTAAYAVLNDWEREAVEEPHERQERDIFYRALMEAASRTNGVGDHSAAILAVRALMRSKDGGMRHAEQPRESTPADMPTPDHE